jgi:hypothetical protein
MPHLTPSGWANYICMRDASASKTLVLLEGPKDHMFYTNHLNKDCCEFRWPESNEGLGKYNILRIMKDATSRSPLLKRTIGIVDADYDRCTGRLTPDNVFQTDAHDIESMIINSSALNKVCVNNVNLKKLEAFLKQQQRQDIRSVILLATRELGFVRLANQTHNLNLSFKQIDILRFIDSSTLLLDTKMLLNELVTTSSTPALGVDEVLTLISDESRKGYDPWQIVNGHDLVKVLSYGLSNLFGNGLNHDPETLETQLRLAYEHSHMKATQLYESVSRWGMSNVDASLWAEI